MKKVILLVIFQITLLFSVDFVLSKDGLRLSTVESTPEPTPEPKPEIKPTPEPVANISIIPPATHWVDGTNGSDSNDGTSETKAWKTISKACSTATAGQTVYIKKGRYKKGCRLEHSGTVDNYITITAAPNEEVIIDDNYTTKMWRGTVEAKTKSYFKINGISIERGGFYGFFMYVGSHHFTIENCKTYDTVSSGIYMHGNGGMIYDFIIKNNTVVLPNQGTSNTLSDGRKFGIQEAISISGAHDFIVKGNDVSRGNKEGIDIKGASYNGKVINNYVHDFPDKTVARLKNRESLYPTVPGIYVDGGRDIEIANNKIRRVTYGIALSTEGWGKTKNISIHDNNMAGGAINGASKSNIMPVGIAFSWVSTYGKVSKYNYMIRNNTIDAKVGISNGEKPEFLYNVTIENNTFHGKSINHRYGKPSKFILKDNISKGLYP